MQFNDNERKFMSISAVALALDLSERTVHRMVADGTLKSIKLGTAKRSARRIPVSEIEMLLGEALSD